MSDRYESSFFALSIQGDVAHLEMNRGDKANAMSPEFWADLPRLAGELGRDPSVRVVVLSGRGKHFSGGMDLAAFQGILGLTSAELGRGAEALYELIRRFQAALSSLEELRVPVKIQGSFNTPKIRVENKAIEDQLKNLAEGALKDEAKSRVEDKVKDKLGDLFKRRIR